MSDWQHDLLSEPILTVRDRDGARAGLSLPAVLQGLCLDRVASFDSLQAHQQHAWHAFLVNVAAAALHRADETKVDGDEAAWRERLLALTGGAGDGWRLRVDDLAKPAFMQPPVPEGDLKAFKNTVGFPDDLDILQTAKSHDVKRSRVGWAAPDHWAYALVTLQTMEGYSGRKNYGIARMNSGFGNRPSVSVVTGASLGTRFVRDTSLLLNVRPRLLADHGYQNGGVTCLWLAPWDGEQATALTALDPFFIEVCRRVRLIARAPGLEARVAPSAAPRIEAAENLGATGDIWTPLKKEKASALTVASSGFSYGLTQSLLFGADFVPAPAQQPGPSDKDGLELSAVAMTRGQGITEGFHRRRVRLPAKVVPLLRTEPGRSRLGTMAKRRVEEAGLVRNKVLGLALHRLLDGTDAFAARYFGAFDRRIDQMFFEALWSDLDLDPDTEATRWQQRLRAEARAVLEDAIRAAPLPSSKRFRAIADAERAFSRAVRKHLGRLIDPITGDPHEPTTGKPA